MHTVWRHDAYYYSNRVFIYCKYYSCWIHTPGPQGPACEKVRPCKARLGSYIAITPIAMFGHDHTS